MLAQLCINLIMYSTTSFENRENLSSNNLVGLGCSGLHSWAYGGARLVVVVVGLGTRGEEAGAMLPCLVVVVLEHG